jgi:hypothetical protein
VEEMETWCLQLSDLLHQQLDVAVDRIEHGLGTAASGPDAD